MESHWHIKHLQLGNSKLPNIDLFGDIEPLIAENAIYHETNIDAMFLLDSYRTQKEADVDEKDEENTCESEDHPISALDVFNNFDDKPFFALVTQIAKLVI